MLPLIEEWADVALVAEPWLDDGQGAVAAAAQLEAHGWDSAIVVSDEWSGVKALEFLEARPEAVSGFVFGHACLEFSTDGPRPTLNPEVTATYEQLLHTDFRSYARAISQTTRGDLDDAVVERILEETSHEDVKTMFTRVRSRFGQSFEAILRGVSAPMLLVRHTECLLWTLEGFEDAVKAFPDAGMLELSRKPSASPEFVDALRRFATDCQRSSTGPAASAG